MDHRLSEAPTRETNVAGYLIQMREGTPQSEPAGEGEEKGGGVPERDHEFWPSTIPTPGRLDLVRIGKFFVPPDFDLAARFLPPPRKCFFFFQFFWMTVLGGRRGKEAHRTWLSGSSENTPAFGKRRLCRPKVGSGDAAFRTRSTASVCPGFHPHIFIFFSRQYPTLRHAATLVT